MSYNFDVQGVYKVLTLESEKGKSVLLCFHTVEDGTAGGAYWVLARKDLDSGAWYDFKHLEAVPRLHPKERANIVEDEAVTRLDAELTLFSCETPVK